MIRLAALFLVVLSATLLLHKWMQSIPHESQALAGVSLTVAVWAVAYFIGSTP